MKRAGLMLGAMAVLAAIAGAGYLVFADTYSGSSCSATPGGVQECVSNDGETLAEVNGNGVLWLLALPVAWTGALAALIAVRAPKALEWLLAILLLAACIVSGFTIGAFFLPAAMLAIAAVALDARAQPAAPRPPPAPA